MANSQQIRVYGFSRFGFTVEEKFTSSLIMVALLRDLSAEVIFRPRSANTMVKLAKSVLKC